MKFKNLLHLVVVLLAGQLLFSCNPARYYEFAGNKQQPYHQLKQKPAPEAPATMAEVALAAAEDKATTTAETPQLEANATATPVAAAPGVVAPVAKTAAAIAAISEAPAASVTEAEMVAAAKEKLASLTKAEKKALKKEIRESQRRNNSDVSMVIKIVLAFLLPPLAVFLHVGLGTPFWISVLLTLLLWVPGVIYALLVVTDTI